MNTTCIDVLIGSPEAILTAGITAALESIPRIRIVACALNLAETIDLGGQTRPDLVVLDGRLCDCDEESAVKFITTGLPSARLLILAEHGGIPHHGAGTAVTRLDRSIAPEALGRAIISAAGGRTDAPALRGDTGGPQSGPVLSAREYEVLQLIAADASSSEIAAQLERSVHTINHHRRNIKRKLQCTHTAALLSKARALGLL